ncbi:polyhydroxyalkanoate depolymerase [Oceanicella actignis]|uniref:polyhydroxyalkanoate depolymerase n=1 Tax=Oceanicella actignis TaxID=1189325 RepID=UPI0011E7A192|nr:polyhydroxyalkanoate depolymerase [Oceanicella actignis]TYO90485.1 poly(3-hydroxybutyrate) depolymerase [Oceanicella actignis]
MLYQAYELTHAAIAPWRAAAKIGQQALSNPLNPAAATFPARATAAALEMFVNATRRYGKPEFGIDSVVVDGRELPVVEEVVHSLPFARLLHFRREGAEGRDDPKVLIVAPMSGHFATLLRGTVEKMLPEHDVYITDWEDARNVPLAAGPFDLDDYIDYVIEFCQVLGAGGERPAVLAVCQPGVPVLAAAAMMAEDEDPCRPSSITLMGSPIDTARNPKQPNELATTRPLSWFEQNVITTVPFPNLGFMRRVYPGFLQLSGFMSMNLDRHVDAHLKQFRHLIRGDGDSAAAHRAFYDEYMAVMDLTAEFYLQTIERVFQKRLLAVGEFMYRDERLVRPEAIVDIALMTVEGEKDDITGLGQTEAAHDLCVNLPDEMRAHYVQETVGHYGVFNGSRWRRFIQPRVRDFIRAHRAMVEDEDAPARVGAAAKAAPSAEEGNVTPFPAAVGAKAD